MIFAQFLTTSRKDFLDAKGSDRPVRDTIHGLLAHGHLMERLVQGFGSIEGLTGIQHQVLAAIHILQGDEGVSVTDLARYLRRSGAFVTIETGKLIRLNILTKQTNDRDRRRVLLKVDARGRAILESVAATQRYINDILFESLDAQEFERFSITLMKLLECGERAADQLDLIAKDRLRQAA